MAVLELRHLTLKAGDGLLGGLHGEATGGSLGARIAIGLGRGLNHRRLCGGIAAKVLVLKHLRVHPVTEIPKVIATPMPS
ncbi:MAG: hypothetical protein IPK12_10925 [Gemmatimonadetes bacterium]|nr:hypothetical protein [Gemmatimonadota bacterium]